MKCKNTALARNNERLQQLNQEKDDIISIVSHDLRSPLAKTVGLIELMRIEGPLNQEQLEYIEMIKRICDNGNSLIQNLLEIRTIESSEPAEQSLSVVSIGSFVEMIAQHHASIASAKDIRILTELAIDDSQTMTTSADYVTRILDNLVSNAIKFSNANSTVFVRCATENDHVQFSVQDEGPGISEEEQSNLFKKFKRLSAKPTAGESSTGLGLSIVKTLVERLNGKIIVRSAPGKGSTFTVMFPRLTVATLRNAYS